MTAPFSSPERLDRLLLILAIAYLLLCGIGLIALQTGRPGDWSSHSKHAGNKQYQQNQHDRTDAPGRVIAEAGAIRPGGKQADQKQYQNHKQQHAGSGVHKRFLHLGLVEPLA
jgi:hypothetical protein